MHFYNFRRDVVPPLVSRIEGELKQNKSNKWRNRIIGEDIIDPSTLLTNPKNWRLHPDKQKNILVKVLDSVGWVQPVLVNKQTGFLVDGHLRVTAAIEKKEESIPVQYVDLSEQEENFILTTFDPIAGLALCNNDALKDLVEESDMKHDKLFKDLFGSKIEDPVEQMEEDMKLDLKYQYKILVDCEDEERQANLLKVLKEGGWVCKPLIL
jgi:hypothetical protein